MLFWMLIGPQKLHDRTSTTAYVVYLGGNAILRLFKKQKSISRSSIEVEYRVVASIVAELAWITSLLHELGITRTIPTIYCDNMGATYLCANPVFHSRIKHVDIDFYFVPDKVATGQLRVSHDSTHDQFANFLTKLLSKQCQLFLRSKIGISNGTTILRGILEISI